MRLNRLRSNQSFKVVYSQAKQRVRSGRFVFYLHKNNLEYSRLGVSVARQYVPKAVERNYIKRINRECFRARQAKLKGFDIIIGLRTNLVDLTRAQLYQHVISQWDRLTKQLGK